MPAAERAASAKPLPRRLTIPQAAAYLGVSEKFFRETIRWEIKVTKTSPGRNGRILIDPAELDRWEALHQEAPR